MSNDILSLEFFQVSTPDKKKNNWMLNQIFCHRMIYLQNQVPLENFWAGGAKWGYMTKNPCHVLAIEISIFYNQLRHS